MCFAAVQIPADPSWSGALIHEVGFGAVWGGVRDVYVALHALNYRFSFTEKGRRGGCQQEIQSRAFIYSFISLFSSRVSQVTLGILKLSLR